ncbi:jerky protein homolog-like [Halyomorpha halys]|uniref:jerky protein homolog-like n=1 Tax=Halyomorpha halys TaxID=286706 RepID=UPI0006D510DA|nr:jerky protein homolog-like [Halyomorpha halys]
MLPNKTQAAKNNKNIVDYKLAKERLTLALYSNGSGTHKFPLFVISKSRKPRAFKNISNLSALPVHYRAQKSAWMDRESFSKWFNNVYVPEVAIKLKDKNLPQKAILLLDNAPSHPTDLKKNEVRTIFLPPNVTPLIQPMDQGVIESLKRRYRSKFLSSLIEKTATGFSLMEAVKSINIKDVIYMLAVGKSFRHQHWKNLRKKSDRTSMTIKPRRFKRTCIPWFSSCTIGNI